jgi:hypothetical protein
MRLNGMWQAAFAIGQFLSGMVVTLLSAELNGLLPALVVMGKAALALAVLSAAVGLWPRPQVMAQSS